ncbi:MAG: sugar phosphate isomerase/epimerase [Candidatus Sumerlaeota bacterium]|nr:sugar phosphate isomerase/epimerase [Candidatus Sumerlaeota bacterium]
MNRREFVKLGVAAAAALGMTAQAKETTPMKRNIKKSLKLSMIPKSQSVEERLKIAAAAGFDGVEPDTTPDPEKVKELRAAADKVGIRLDAIICSKHWSSPLSDPDPKKADECMEAMRVSLRNAKDMGGDLVLLVPAVVKPDVSYQDAWTRSIPRIKELAKDAESLGIMIGLENVWNRFLLSPIEFLRYLDEIGSPMVQAWFDVGNILLYGYPQDWIRTLGKRIARIDVKDYDTKKKEFVPLKEGSVPWPEVMRALDEIHYEGYFAAEVKGGDLAYLTETVSRRMDEIIAL